MSLIQPQPLPQRSAQSGPSTQAQAPRKSSNLPPLARIEKQYRTFLSKRYIGFAWRSALWTSAVLSTSIVLYTGSSGRIPYAILLSLPVFVSLAAVLRVRKSYITRPPKYTPRATLVGLLISSFWNERSITLLFSYALFSLSFSNVWCTLVGSDEFALFSPTTRHHFAINERRVILCGSSLLLALTLAVRDVMGDKLKPIWPQKKVPFARSVRDAITANMGNITSTSFSLTFTWSLVVPFVYKLVLRGYIWKWVNWRVWALFFRPFIGSFARASSRAPSAWSLAPQLLVLDLVMLLVLQLPIKAMMPYITQSPLSPERYLITALKSQDRYYLQFTLMELLRISHIPAKRKIIFDDISKSPLALELWQALLLQLGQVHSNLSGSSSTSSTPSAPSRPSAPDPRAIPVKQGDIFRPVTKQKSGYSLSSVLDGPIRSVPPEPVAKVTELGAVAVKRAEEVQGQVIGKIQATPVGGAVLSEAKGYRASIEGWMGEEWARRGLRVSNAGVEEWLIAQRIIDIVTTLSIASIEEDTYGHVQQVLPASLEGIVRIRAALGFVEARLNAQIGILPGGRDGAAVVISGQVGSARAACDASIKRIAEAFGSSMGAFRFPPSIAQTLGEICRS
ncbi:hypothetical protein I316_07732 [Kwoniella heveanensis BCC8398]|uniref:Nucleoporin NDC1 n=1 Tax=Kwoniella heveanensis BCC8398 TaxID=1296120 RepID=A0A1B9GHQ4_9TREE|nr:hypothetical protein I316_07732 [Kwoniella heveanensis BCC8398]